MYTDPDPTTELAVLASQLRRVEALLELPAAQLLEPLEDVSGWSIGEHAYHLVLACDLSLRNVASLVKDEGMLVREPVDRKDEALAILAAGIPRGAAEAPRFVRPPARLDLGLLRELLAQVGAVRDDLAARVDEVLAAPRCVPHQLLGDLTASEWVRFARVHTDHHLAIVDDIVAARDAS